MIKEPAVRGEDRSQTICTRLVGHLNCTAVCTVKIGPVLSDRMYTGRNGRVPTRCMNRMYNGINNESAVRGGGLEPDHLHEAGRASELYSSMHSEARTCAE